MKQRLKQRPRLLIAAIRSSSGKTSIATGLMGALARKGYRVQGFKVGPDFIDPSYHSAVTGRWSRNLDSWMLSPEMIRRSFVRATEGTDIAIIEGVMGLFDGLRGHGEKASSAEIAKLLNCPVVLVQDVHAQARSAVVDFLGCRAFDPRLDLAGVILNRVGSRGHLQMLHDSFKEAGIPVLGDINDKSLPPLSERHLGLVPVLEQQGAGGLLEELITSVASQLDLSVILDVAGSASSHYYNLRRGSMGRFRARLVNPGPLSRKVRVDTCIEQNPIAQTGPALRKVRIAYAWDRAFNFYYRDGLDLLEQLGAELVPFSPVQDRELPLGVCGVLIGGGFPELFVEQLAANEAMKVSLRRTHAAGMPIYAECGGFMYLCREVGDLKGQVYAMVGLIPGSCRMEKRLAGMGYICAKSLSENILCRSGDTIRGHEFHYSSFTPDTKDISWAFELRKAGEALRGTGEFRYDGYARGSLLASYLHFNFASSTPVARRFIASCRRFAGQLRDKALSW